MFIGDYLEGLFRKRKPLTAKILCRKTKTFSSLEYPIIAGKIYDVYKEKDGLYITSEKNKPFRILPKDNIASGKFKEVLDEFFLLMDDMGEDKKWVELIIPKNKLAEFENLVKAHYAQEYPNTEVIESICVSEAALLEDCLQLLIKMKAKYFSEIMPILEDVYKDVPADITYHLMIEFGIDIASQALYAE